jgi:mono/diheme cytochrome c family protein
MTRALLAAFALTLWGAGGAWGETLLERGAYLMNGIVACGNCHTPQTPQGPAPGMELAGGNPIKDEAFEVQAPNITPHPESGIGRWTDEQIIAAIREGRRPDGSIIGPPMPIGLYRGLADRDVEAIVAYLRTVKPVSNTVAEAVYHIPLPPSYGPPVGRVAEPPRADKVAYGAYLAGALGHCIECHTPFVGGRPDFENQLGAGGFPFFGPWGTSVAANITPHPESGLGKWSDAQIKTVITTGVRPDGSRLLPPMAIPYYASIRPDDLDALVAYLRSLEPIDNVVR